MSEPGPTDRQQTRARLERRIERRKRREKERRHGVVFGLGVFGLVGWSVAIPTVLGAALGWWLDHRVAEHGFSWTLAMLLAGVALGCFNAWYWIERERTRPTVAIEDDEEK